MWYKFQTCIIISLIYKFSPHRFFSYLLLTSLYPTLSQLYLMTCVIPNQRILDRNSSQLIWKLSSILWYTYWFFQHLSKLVSDFNCVPTEIKSGHCGIPNKPRYIASSWGASSVEGIWQRLAIEHMAPKKVLILMILCNMRINQN